MSARFEKRTYGRKKDRANAGRGITGALVMLPRRVLALLEYSRTSVKTGFRALGFFE